jgi:hypothetical protein
VLRSCAERSVAGRVPNRAHVSDTARHPGVEQFGEHFQLSCRVSLLIGYSTDFIRAAPILADSIDSFALRSGSISEVDARNGEVCFTPMTGHRPHRRSLPKSAKKRHQPEWASSICRITPSREVSICSPAGTEFGLGRRYHRLDHGHSPAADSRAGSWPRN